MNLDLRESKTCPNELAHTNSGSAFQNALLPDVQFRVTLLSCAIDAV